MFGGFNDVGTAMVAMLVAMTDIATMTMAAIVKEKAVFMAMTVG